MAICSINYSSLLELQAEIGALLGINIVIDNTPLPKRWQKVKRWLKR
jgi:hypothetical protein